MTKPVIVTRESKGSALSWTEGDTNLTNLRDATITVSDGTSSTAIDLNGTITFAAGSGISVDESTGTITISNTQSAGISNLVEDTTPQLGGDLDGQGQVVSFVELKKYKETIYSLGSTDSPSLDYANGNVQSVTISSGLSLPAFSSAAAGQSITLLVSGSGTATGATGYKFAGGSTTLTNYSVISIFYDGTTYWASVATDFQ